MAATATDDKAIDIYDKGTRAWFPDDDLGWVMGSLTTKTVDAKGKLTMSFFVENRKKEVVFESTLEKLAANKYQDLPPLMNPPKLAGCDDLTNLSYLHEPGVLYNIQLRYAQEQIYTYSGIVLIAMNPFKRLNMYTPEIMREYSGKRRDELEPHLFAVAEQAYRNMIKERKNQSIIISGESGAGKTQSAKYIMRYFAIVDELNVSRVGSSQDISGVLGGQGGNTTEIEEAVLSTNPIMEAFGNSKTTRNDNSSRFGKYIEIMFENKTDGPGVRITGAKIRTYLLERSRLIFQPASERNYHIFYQLCAAAPAAERKELGLGTWETFHFLNQGGTGVVNGMDDNLEFGITQKALSTIGISVSVQWEIFRICAALLHIGNIKITALRDEAMIADDDPALLMATKLLGVEASQFKKWIVKKQIVTRSEKIITGLNAVQAMTGRDSIAKFIYSMLFDWLVKIVNVNLTREELSKDGRFIGVLDIYGFEHFKKNSFEQFCINYANEKLQQEFNQHVFKLEQEEYVAEKISWSFIEFNDNQPCIDMIENKLGILDLLDEESRLPSGADGSLITKLYQRFGTAQSKFFEKPRFGQQAFTIKHYATDVTYEIEGFIDKNKDTVADEQLAMLNESSFAFLREVIKIEEVVEVPKVTSPSAAPGRRTATSKKPTLGSIFKGSLVQLMETIRQTEVHYIRCIKPNQAKVAFEFEPPMVLSQLRACGVLETIRISCAGYPNRQTFQEFSQRFYFLVPSKEWVSDEKELTLKVVKSVITDEDKFQVGISKIFFRAGQIAYIEKLRSDRFRECVIIIQKNMRRLVAQNRYRRQRQAAITLQKYVRGHQARMKYKKMRETKAAITIQKYVRGWLARRNYRKTKQSVVKIQRAWRGYKARGQLVGLRREKAALKIQKVWRGHVARKEYRRVRQRIILIQSCVRRRRAIKELKQLKTEARSVGKLKEVNYRLESKVVELSQSVAAKNKENNELSEKLASLEAQVASWKEKFLKADAENKSKNSSAVDENVELKKELAQAHEARDASAKEVDRAAAQLRKRDNEIAQANAENANLQEEVKKLKEQMRNAPKVVDDSATVAALKKEVASLREQMGRLLAGKYRADRATEQLLNADYAAANPYPPAPVTQPVLQPVASAARASMAFFGSAAATVAETLTRGSSMTSIDRAPAPRQPIIEDEPEQKERPIRMLEAADLEDEVIDSLITNLRIPLPSTQTVATKKEIFFPAHLIGYLMSELLEHDMVQRMRILDTNVMKAIQSLTMKFEDDYVSAFWLSNTFELICVAKTARERLPRKSLQDPDDEQSADVVLIGIRNDLEHVMLEIYHGWIKELKKRLANMIVPAVIENQSLPGYICKQSGGIWGKWAKTTSTSQFTIDQLLNFLSKLSKTMRCYYMEESMSRQILTELLRVIGVSAFNHLLMRKNFCTWKRGVQIQYNVSRLEEWCSGHGIPEATLHLQQLLQAAKLLTLNKTSPQDIDTIFDVCFLLNNSQIKKLLSLYYAADFDSPLSPDLMKMVSNRAAVNEKSDVLLLDLDQGPEFSKPNPRTIKQIEKFIPAWISLPYIQAVISASLSTPAH
ncbi:P-loop containing nucleoside triphosphate hydrolase protein [Entophlyctis helioformis]|nr:P-loop containing nucleoside triphosphate hydrolase protein [Entophlyctis helioformis]